MRRHTPSGRVWRSLRGAFGRRGPRPMWRPVDRARRRARMLLVAGLLVSLAANAVLAAHAVATAPARARAGAAKVHRIDALVLGPVRPDAPAVATRFRAGELVRVGWTYPADHPVVGRIELLDPVSAGQPVPVWVTDRGELADTPQGAGALMLLALAGGALGVLTLGLGLAGLYLLRCRTLDRRAHRAWAADWARVEPHWSGRVDGRPGNPAA
ncbi:hypothetical protein ACFW1A_38105 [Kitasatospora sp. NPDC058965]|uniref:hypothetical protein n=1 Tax=Kitasatospora sp. NPDC058965 TaxID=3346682 RepID=UPI00367D3ED1